MINTCLCKKWSGQVARPSNWVFPARFKEVYLISKALRYNLFQPFFDLKKNHVWNFVEFIINLWIFVTLFFFLFLCARLYLDNIVDVDNIME
jgi:hypothetical protein